MNRGLIISCLLFTLLTRMGSSPSKEFGEASIKVLTKETEATASGPRDVITFAAGCFWGIELAFQRVPGVIKTEVGYTQGKTKDPTYEEVCTGSTGHAEAVRVTFDTNAISVDDLLTVFWDIHDPTTLNRQGNDMGTQYRSGIYYRGDLQKVAVDSSKAREQEKYEVKVVTEVLPEATWYPAEDYHQQYLQKGGQCSGKGDLTPIRCYG